MSIQPALFPLLLPEPTAKAEETVQSTFAWATVSSINPLRVRIDGQADPLPMTPEMIGSDGYSVGSRVWLQSFGLRRLILGGSAGSDSIIRRAGEIMSGGGVRKVSATGVSWSDRFLTMGSGKNPQVPSGYFQIEMPPNGTVIPVLNKTGVTTVTVSGGEVPLNNWDTLYYTLPLGQAQASQPGNFLIVNYTSAGPPMPGSAIPIITRNGDANSDDYRWFDRTQSYWRTLSLAGAWVNFGSVYETAQYKREAGYVETMGLVKSGSSTIATFGAGYQPNAALIFLGGASDGIADIRITAAGSLYLSGFLAGGTNASVSLAGIRWEAQK